MTTIRQLREERGWSQFDLALKVGVRPETVYQWETGRAIPKVLQLRKLAEIFGISSDTITLVRREHDRRHALRPRRAGAVTLDDLIAGKWSINRQLDELVLQALDQSQGDRRQAAKQLAAWIEQASLQRVDPRDRRLLEEALLAWTPDAELADHSAPDEAPSAEPSAPQLGWLRDLLRCTDRYWVQLLVEQYAPSLLNHSAPSQRRTMKQEHGR
jgi:transcriptional regulator with XRE-family HTH domain